MKHIKNPAQDGIDALKLETQNIKKILKVLKTIEEISVENLQSNDCSKELTKKEIIELIKDAISLGEDFDCFEE